MRAIPITFAIAATQAFSLTAPAIMLLAATALLIGTGIAALRDRRTLREERER